MSKVVSAVSDVVSVSREVNDVSCVNTGVLENLSNAVAARPNREPDQPSVPTVDAENDLPECPSTVSTCSSSCNCLL